MRESEHCAYSLTQSVASALAQPQWQNQQQEVRPLLEAENETDAQHALSSYALHTSLSLLTGAFKRRSRSASAWRGWRAAGISALVLVLLLIGKHSVYRYQFEQQSAALHAESERIFHQIFPDRQRIPTTSYLKRLMNEEIERLNGNDESSSVLAKLDVVSAKITEINGMKIDRMTFEASNHQIRLNLQGSDFQQFDAAKTVLSSDFTVQSGPLNRNSDAVQGVLTLSWEPAQ